MTTLRNFQDVELEVKRTNLEVERLLTDVRLILDRINHITGISGSFSASPSLATDHGILSGLGDDDHPHYLLASGTRELTGNWDAGPFSITALTLISDVATGTAPLTVASTTVVPNLNVDQVDGFDLDQDVRIAASPTFAGLDLTEGNITNVGNISLDSIIADGSTITIGGTPSIVLTNGTTIAVTLGNDAGDNFAINTTAFVVEGNTGLVGVGTATPFQDVAGGTSDLSGGGIHVKGGTTRVIIEGTVSVINMINLSGGVDDKVLSFAVGSTGTAKWLSSNDDLTTRIDNIQTMDMGSGGVGFGVLAMDGHVHIHTATAGGVTAAAAADELVLENSGNAGMHILNPDASTSSIYFGSPGDPIGALITWSYGTAGATSLMSIGTSSGAGQLALLTGAGSEAVRIDASGDVGINTPAPASGIALTIEGVLRVRNVASTRYRADLNPVGATGLTLNSYDDTGAVYLPIKINGNPVLFNKGSVGVGATITSPDGTMHIHTATAGSVTAHAGADELVLENSTGGGMSILTPNASTSQIYFGSPSENAGATVNWNYNSKLMVIGSQTASGEIALLTGAGTETMRLDSSQNIGIRTPDQFGSGTGVLGVKDAGVNPSTNPTGGGVLYSDGGAGKWRSAGGTTTTFGPAEPYCEACGRDFVLEWENKKTGHLIVCMWCLTENLGEEKWITRVN